MQTAALTYPEHRFFQLDLVRTHSQHVVKSHAVANTEFQHDINSQTVVAFLQKSASFAYSSTAPVALNGQPDLQSPSHYQLKLKAVGNAINGSLDCYGYVPEAVGFAANLPSTSQNPVQDLFPSVAASPPVQSDHFQASWQSNIHAWVICQNVPAIV